VLLTEEALADPGIDELAATLQTQPAWSDVSLLLFAGDDRSQATIRTLRTLEVMRNVTLLDRPIRVTAVGRPRYLWPGSPDMAARKNVMEKMIPGWIQIAARLLWLGFLPSTPLHVIVDTKLQARDGYVPNAPSLAKAADRAVHFGRYRKFLAQLVPPMLKRAEELARTRAEREIAAASAQAQRSLGAEAARLVALRTVNPAVREEEVAAVNAELEALAEALPKSRPRLDAVRFVCSPDFLALR
jgi:hypothetical protein